MSKVCPKCGASANEDKSLFCKKCGTQLLPPVSELKTSDRSFRYSTLFALVIYSDLLLCFIFCIAFIESYLDISSANYLNPFALYFVIIFPANFILDLLLLKNGRETPNSIDIRICWIKGLIGVAGILTIISGLYFIIISVKMDSAYKASVAYVTGDPKLRTCNTEDKDLKKLNPLNENPKTGINDFEKLKIEIDNSLSELESSGNIQLIRNFIERYPNFDTRGQNFSNLNTLLAKKGIRLTNFELMSIISSIKQKDELQYVKTCVLYNNPTSSDGCIKNYIEAFGKLSQNEQKDQLINYLIKILKDNFNYQGNLASDLIRIKKDVELERFENSLTYDQASGTGLP